MKFNRRYWIPGLWESFRVIQEPENNVKQARVDEMLKKLNLPRFHPEVPTAKAVDFILGADEEITVVYE